MFAEEPEKVEFSTGLTEQLNTNLNQTCAGPVQHVYMIIVYMTVYIWFMYITNTFQHCKCQVNKGQSCLPLAATASSLWRHEADRI